MARDCPECGGQGFMTMNIHGDVFYVDTALLTHREAREASVECVLCGASWKGYVVGGTVNSAGYMASGDFYPTQQIHKGGEE